MYEEVLKFAANGQWTLEKNWKGPQVKAVENWADTGNRSHLSKLPAATGKLRENMLGKLNMESSSRLNPKTNEKEYKVYRAAHIDDNTHNNKLTSWTVAPSFAHYWANNGGPETQKVMHAWVPEKHVHSYLPYIQEKHKQAKDEGELLVNPHKFNIERTVTGQNLLREGAKHGEPYKKPKYHVQFGDLKLTREQSRKMHNQPHPTQPGRVYNHSDNRNESGYNELPGYKYDIEGNNWVGKKNGKVVHTESL
jgi:hypothetical protein